MGPSRAIVVTLNFILILETTKSNVNAYDQCKELGICDKVDNYPTELVKGLIQELKSKNTLFSYDEFDMSLSSRFNDYKEDLCVSIPQQIVPRKAKDAKGIERIILNDYDDPVQKFNIATCVNKHSSCHKALGYSPNYKGVCIQKTTLREMYYLDDKNQSATTYFPLPTCCSCMLVRFN